MTEFLIEKDRICQSFASVSIYIALERANNPLLAIQNTNHYLTVTVQYMREDQMAASEMVSRKRGPDGTIKPYSHRDIDHWRTVKIDVGPKSFTMHQEILCRQSSYFRRAFAEPGFMEAETGHMTVQEQDPGVFNIFFDWIYTQHIHLDPTNTDETNSGLLFRLHIYADMVHMTDLMNATMDAIVDLANRTKKAPYSEIAYVYQNTTDKSILRACMAVLIARYSELGSLKEKLRESDVPVEACLDIICVIKERLRARVDLIGQLHWRHEGSRWSEKSVDAAKFHVQEADREEEA